MDTAAWETAKHCCIPSSECGEEPPTSTDGAPFDSPPRGKERNDIIDKDPSDEGVFLLVVDVHYIFQVPCVNACQDLGSPGEAVSNPPGEAGQARGEDLDQPAADIQVGVRQALLPAAYIFSNSE